MALGFPTLGRFSIIPEAAIWRELDTKRWIWPLLFEARFAKGVARKRKLARKKLCVYKKSKSGRVSGGPDLKATGAYTSVFCQEVCKIWQDAWSKGLLPKQRYDSMEDLLRDCGFFGSSSIAASASAAPSSSSANQDSSEVAPRLRRMSKLVPGFQIVWPSITPRSSASFWFLVSTSVFEAHLGRFES